MAEPSRSTTPFSRTLSEESEAIVETLKPLQYDVDQEISPTTPDNKAVAAWRWYSSWAIPGMGMFSEAYMIFAIGNIEPFLAVQYPYCWGDKTPSNCNETTVNEVATVEICGVIFGMLLLGLLADIIGRKWGSRMTATIMSIGGILLTGAYGTNAQQFLSVFCFSLFFFGTGVGGEYPLSASSSIEKAEEGAQTRKKRGELVVLTFSQQGWGNFINVVVILLLMLMTGATSDPILTSDAEIIWRCQFAVGTAVILCLAAYRAMYLKESKVWEAARKHVKEVERALSSLSMRLNSSASFMSEEDKKDKDKKQQQVNGNTTTTAAATTAATTATARTHHGMKKSEHEIPKSWTRAEYWLIFRFYWPRLFITAGAWLISDIAFYGSKLFQSTFISVLSPGASTFERLQWTLLNSAVSLVGYYFAAYTIDKQWYGRRRMQAVGFFMVAILFLLCGTLYETLIDNAIQAFQFLYFFSSFWMQFGPNCTTFLVAGEVYPTEVRAFFHGVSASMGKVGALIAAQAFPSLSNTTIYYVNAGVGFLGFILTIVFLPDTTGLDLSEVDRKFEYYLGGVYHDYCGEAVNPKYLSYFERWMGYGKHYNKKEDARQLELQRHNSEPAEYM
jgi:MFS family permease